MRLNRAWREETEAETSALLQGLPQLQMTLSAAKIQQRYS